MPVDRAVIAQTLSAAIADVAGTTFGHLLPGNEKAQGSGGG